MSEFHEPPEELEESTRSYRRALNSMMEELEAIDWYQQRIDATKDKQLRAILNHNRDEEIEHACMTLEWMRRNMDGWDEQLRTYLFTEGEITELESAAESEDSSNAEKLNIGKIDPK
ncbi:MAG TPA: ferritin-like domain-containing protein [Fodinibius sp.]|nr:ferritin-like domain-containing protein [Fodinibius sp.]